MLEENQEQLLLKLLQVLQLVVIEANNIEHFDNCAASNALYQRLIQLYLRNGGENPKKCKRGKFWGKFVAEFPDDEFKIFFNGNDENISFSN